jgi:hypothetical protein
MRLQAGPLLVTCFPAASLQFPWFVGVQVLCFQALIRNEIINHSLLRHPMINDVHEVRYIQRCGLAAS